MGKYLNLEPRDKPFDKMTKKEVESYFQWFIKYIPEAILELSIRINKRMPLINWQPDYSEESLKIISNWLFDLAELIEKPIELVEQEIIIHNYPEHIAYTMRNHRKFLTEETSWACFLVGIYFGETLKKNVSGIIFWDYKKGTKNDVNLNEPILVKSSTPKAFIPFRSVIPNTLLVSITKQDSGNAIFEMYKQWERILIEGIGFLSEEFRLKIKGSF